MRTLKALLAIAIAIAGLVATQNDADAQGFFAKDISKKATYSKNAKYGRLLKGPGVFYDVTVNTSYGSMVIITCKSTKPCYPRCSIGNVRKYSSGGLGTFHTWVFSPTITPGLKPNTNYTWVIESLGTPPYDMYMKWGYLKTGG